MIRKIAQTLCFGAALTISAHAAVVQKLDARINAARDVLQELAATPDKGIPDAIASKATCVAVIPGLKKGAFMIGGEHGQGVVTCRTGHGWSAPAFIQITGASFGLQIGGESADVVLVGVSHDAAERLLKDKLKLGADAAVAAGPVGRNAQANTTELANAAFLSYSRSKGVFAGLDLAGDEVNQNMDDTRAYYGKDVSYQQILHGDVHVHPSAEGFIHAVSQLFHEDQDHR